MLLVMLKRGVPRGAAASLAWRSSGASVSSLRALSGAAVVGKAAGKQDGKDEAKKPGKEEMRSSIRRIVTLAKPEAKLIGASMGTLLATSSISLLFPNVIGQVLDLSLTDATGLSPPLLVGGLAGLFVVQAGLIVGRTAMLTVAGERFVARLRKQLFTSIIAQEQGFFDKTRTGELVNRLSADTQLVQRSVTGNLIQGLRAMFMAVGATGMLFYTSPMLAFVSLSVIPPVGLAARRFGRSMKQRQGAVQDALAETSAIAEEVISNVRTVRQFAGEPVEVAKYDARIDSAYRRACQVGLSQAWFDGTVHLAANFSLVAVLGYGGSLVYSKELTAGALTSFLMYSLYVGFNVTNIGTAYSDLMKGVGASARIFELIDKKPDIPSSITSALNRTAGASSGPDVLPASVLASIDNQGIASSGKSPMGSHLFGIDPDPSLTGHETPYGTAVSGSSGAQLVADSVKGKLLTPPILGNIELRDVAFAYPQRLDVPILNGLSLSVKSGESVALVGASGSGKSTIGMLITRLYEPQNGEILVDGVSIKDLDPHWLRRHVGVVAQEPVLFSGTIEENIRYGNPQATREQILQAAKNASALQFIEKFPDGLSTLVGERGLQLSGGQKQRVAIARVFLKDPPVVLLDEATSALDAESEYLVQNAIERMMKGRSVLSIAHRLSSFVLADKIAVLEHGRIVEQGTHDELVKRKDSKYFELVQKQLATL